MIKKFINRLLGRSEAAAPLAEAATIPLGVRREFARAEHGIDAQLLDVNAVRVVRTLKEAGYEAYVVGGAVRDLIVGLRPKDFDVATDATPEQVKAQFRRAFIIGRRFRLVHVVFGRGREHETIEVSTFRAYLDSSAAEQVDGNEKTAKGQLAAKGQTGHVVDASGRVLRDNVWGPQIEDAARRDFTINAMYYDPVSQVVVDYHGGLVDAKARIIRMIGDPETRYREDPVRIIRVVRFAAKLGFALDPATEAPVRRMAALLSNVPISRLFDEMVKLLQTGHAIASIEQLRKRGLERGVFPVLEAALAPAQGSVSRETFVRLALEDTDRRVAEDRSVAPSFLLACLLWHDVLQRWSANREAGEPALPALQLAVDAVFDARIGDISGRGKLAADMREIWLMQPRFERRTVNSVPSLAGQPRFRAGYDFLRLRADSGELPVELADWWEDYHLGGEDGREAMLQDLRAASTTRVKRGAADAAGIFAAPVVRPAAAQPVDKAVSADEVDSVGGVDLEVDGIDAPAKRRRRRRRRGTRPDGPGSAES